MNKIKKTVVVGLDGAAWEALDFWMEKNELPNIKNMIEEGVRGTLKSVIPPVTSPAWKCYSTGKNPGKLGVYWWANFDREKGKLITPDVRSYKGRDLWDYLGDEGVKSAVINMPTTYPPQSLNGIMVSGLGAPVDKDFDYDQPYTYPREKQREIEEKYDYEVGIPNPRGFQKEKLSNKVIELIHKRFDLAKDLVESDEYGFVNITIFYINVLQHFFGTDKVVKDAWKAIDKRIGKLRNEKVNMIIISDHGTTSIDRSVTINNWLLEKGYLNLKKDFGDTIKSLEEKLGKILGLEGKCFPGTTLEIQYLPGRGLSKILPDSLSRKWVGMMGDIPTKMIDLKIDWQDSKAVALGQGPIYLNTEKLGENYEKTRQELVQQLQNMKDSKTGEKIFEKVYKKENLYKGDNLEMAPDIILLPKKGYEVYGGLTRKIIHDKRVGWTTGNHPEGIFIAHGPNIAKGTEVEGAEIIDVSPTILHMMGFSVPKDMDGKVLKEIFGKGSPPAEKKVEYQEEIGEEDRIKGRIKSLKKKGQI